MSFDSEEIEDILVDEPEPLGSGEYPNAGKILAAAVGSCLSASLAYCLRRSGAQLQSVSSDVYAMLKRNERGRLRFSKMSVDISVDADSAAKLERCRSLFEDFCIVTQSVREGFEIEVDVKSRVHPSQDAP